MEVNKFFKRYWLLGVILVSSVLIYLPIFRGFFEQDEWATFGWYILHSNMNLINTIKFLFAFDVGHYNPLTNTTQFILFSIWRTDFIKYATFGLFLHLLVVVSVFFLARKIFKKDLIRAFIVTLLFSFFASNYQAVSWELVNTATLSASLFGIWSTFFFLNFTENKKRKYLLLSILLLIISLLFKEITLGLFPLFFLCLFFSSKKKNLFDHNLFYLIISGGGYLLLRILMFFSPNTTGDKLVTQTSSFVNIIYNFITIPFKTISEVVSPQELVRSVSQKIAGYLPIGLTGQSGTTKFDLFVIGKIMEPFFLITALAFILLVLYICFKKKNKFGNFLLFFVGFIVLNSFIFALAPETNGIITVIDSRNLYFVSIGVAFLIVFLLLHFKIRSVGITIFLIIFMVLNFYYLNLNLHRVALEGSTRKMLLEEITYYYPSLSKKMIVYTQSDSSYYGLPPETKIMPFQSGFGQTLLVWYYNVQKFPAGFFQDKFLWDITSQGYKEINGVGFGYFRDRRLLLETLYRNRIGAESVIAFDWKNGKLRDITNEVRNEIQKNKF